LPSSSGGGSVNEAQGHGLGRVLMSFAEEEAARRGLTRTALVTHEVMTENQAIYAPAVDRDLARGGAGRGTATR